MKLFTTALGIALLAGAIAGPVSYDWGNDVKTTECATSCPSSSKFTYEPGTVYEYSYESDLKTSIQGSTEEHSSLHMQATVQVEVLAQCEMALRLSDVSLKDSEPRSYESRNHVEQAWEFKRALQEKTLRFAFLNGQIGDLCPSPEEETWVLNIKRGILSAFQNTQHSLDQSIRVTETDVTGTCPVEYEPMDKSGSVFKVKKTKSIIGCTDRHNFDTAFQAMPYRVHSNLQSLPLMKSSHECQQEINRDGLLIQSLCEEEHVFRPFSSYQNGAATTVSYKLSFTKRSSDVKTRQETVSKRTSLLYENVPNMESEADNKREVTEIMTELCQQTSEDIRPESPALFSKLIHELRKSKDSYTLSQLHKSTERICDKAHKFFHDAIPMLMTPASIQLIHKLISSQEASGTEADTWLTSLAFIPNPTTETLVALKPLIEMEANRKAYLSVSSVVNTYCKLNPACADQSEVQTIINVFENNLRLDGADESQHDKVLMSLKAIGNTGHAEKTIPALNRCFMSSDNPMEIRIAALQSFRRMTCDVDLDDVMKIFNNEKMCSELRINAYLTLMQCPTTRILNSVREALENEEINQVGSFVWTHLTNLMETSNPHKQMIREFLENVKIENKFDLDKRKYSRNIEWSAFTETLNAGAQVESNLIWSTKSFIPRSAMVNLTVDMFGQSVNLLEVGGRAEGFERFLEGIFAEGGSDEEVSNNEVNSVGRGYKVKYGAEGPSGSYYIKVFGNEIRYDDFHNLDMDAIKDKFNFLEWLIELSKQHDFDYTKSAMFLDTTMKIPTAVGIPLTLKVDGTFVMDMKVSGKLDLRKMSSNPRSVHIGGSIKPSAAVQINAEMGVDAYIAKTGLKMMSTVHTSTVTDGLIELKDGKIFNFDINLPRDKMEIFNAESKFFVTYRNEQREQRMITEGRIEETKCVGDNLVKVMGFEVCGEVSSPHAMKQDNAPWFPMTGPSSVKLYLQKKDSLTGYHFEGKLMQEKASDGGITDIARVAFNTPGSRVNREISYDFSLKRGQSMDMSLNSPWKKASLSAAVVRLPDLKRATGRFVIDESQEYSVIAEVQINEKKLQTEYTPKFEISIPSNSKYVSLGGGIQYREGRKFDLDMNLDIPHKSGPFDLKGSIVKIDNKKRNRYDVNIEIGSTQGNGKVSGYMDWMKGDSDILNSELSVEFTKKGYRKESHTMITKLIRDLEKPKVKQLFFESEMTSTTYPEWDSKFTLDLNKKISEYSALLTALRINDERKSLTLSASGAHDLTGPDKTVKISAAAKCPYKSMDYEVTVEHKHNQRELATLGFMNYGVGRRGLVEINLARESEQPLKMTGDMKLHYPGREFGLQESVEEIQPGEYKHDLKIQLDKYTNVVVDSTYKKSPRHEFEADVTITNMEPMSIKAHLKPTMQDFQAFAKIAAFRREYSTDTTWSHRGSLSQFTTRGTTEFVYPSRTVKVTGSASRRGDTIKGEVETMYDATTDSNKKVTVSMEMEKSMTQPQMMVKTSWYPNKFFEISANGKYDEQGWYHHTRDLNGEFAVKSSYGIMGAKFTHEQSTSNIKTHTESYWQDQKIVSDLNVDKLSGWSNIKSVFAMTSTIPTLYRANNEISYNYNARAGSLDLAVSQEWNREKVGIAMNGRANLANHMIEGTSTFTSSFRDYEEITMRMKHSDNSRVFDSEMEVTYGPSKTVSGFLHMEHAMSGWEISNLGSLKITTPLRSYSTYTVNWNHQNARGSINTHMDVATRKGRSDFDLTANHIVNRAVRQIGVSMTFKCPFSDNVKFTFEHKHPRSGLQGVNTAITAEKGSDVIQFTSDLEVIPSPYKLKHNLKFTSPFKYLELITIDLDNLIDSSSSRLNNEIKWNQNSKISLEGVYTNRGNAIHSNIRLLTPFRPVERVTLTLDHQQQRDTYTSSSSLSYDGERIQATSTIETGSSKGATFQINTPFDAMRNINLKLSHQGVLRAFESSAELKHNKIADMAMTLSFDSSNLADIKGDILISGTRNFAQGFDPIKFNFFHKKEGQTTYRCEGELDYNVASVVFTNAMTLNRLSDFTTDTSLTLKDARSRSERGVQVMTVLQTRPTMTAKFQVTSPGFAPSISTSVSHEGNMNNFKCNGKFAMDGQDIFVGDIASVYDRRSLDSSVKILLPTVRNYESNSFAIKHNGVWQMFSSNGEMNIGGRRGAVDVEFKLAKQTTGKLEIVTPFPGYESIKTSFQHTGVTSRFENSGTFEIFGKTYTGESDFRLWGSNMVGSATVAIPQKYSISLKHKGRPRSFSNVLNILMNRDRLNINSAYEYGKNGIQASSTMRTPYPSYAIIITDFNFRGEPTDFTTNGNIKIKKNQVLGFDIKHQGTLAAFTSTAKIDTPSRKLPTFTVSAEHAGNRNDFRTGGSVEYLNRKIQANTNFKRTAKSIEGEVSFESPYKNMEKYSGTFKHTFGRGYDFDSTAAVETSIRGYDRFGVSANHQGGWEGFQNALTVTTPYPQMPSATIRSNHRGNAQDFTSGINAEYNNKKMEGQVNFKNSGSWGNTDFETGLTLNSPYDYLRNLALNWQSKRQETAVSGKMDATYNSDKKLDFDYAWTVGGRSNVELNLNHPYKMATEMTLEVSGSSIASNAIVNWDKTNPNSNIRLDLNLASEKNGYNAKRELSFKAIHPQRTVGLMTVYTITGPTYNYKVETQWNTGPKDRFTYEIEYSKNMRRSMNTFDGKLIISAPMGEFESNFNCICHQGRAMNTVIMVKKPIVITFKHDLTQNAPEYKSVITVSHAKFSKDATLTLSGTIDPDNSIWDGTAMADYEDQHFEVKGRVADESRRSNTKYVMSGQLSHPRSMLDIQIAGSIEDDSEKSLLDSTFKYQMTRDRSYKIMSLRTEINKLRQELNIDIKTPMKNMNLIGQRSENMVTFRGNMGDQEFNGEGSLDLENYGAGMKLQYNPSNMIHMYSKLLSPSAYQVEAYRTNNGVKTQDVLLAMKLKNPNLLHSQAFMRPELFEDMAEMINGVDFNSRSLRQMSSEIKADMSYKQRYLGQALEPFQSVGAAFSDAYNEKYEEVLRNYRQMYRTNQYYVRDIAQYFAEARETLTRTMDSFHAQVEEWNRILSTKIDSVIEYMSEKYDVWAEKAMEVFEIYYSKMAAFEEKIGMKLRKVKECVREFSPKAIEKFNQVKEWSKETLMDLFDKVRSHPQVDSMINKISTFSAYDLVPRNPESGSWGEWYLESLEKGKMYMEKIKSNPKYRQFMAWAKETIKDSQWAYRYFEVEEGILKMIKEIYEGGVEVGKIRVYEQIDNVMQFEKTRVTSYGDGDLQVEVYIPYGMRDLTTPKIPNIRKYIIRVRNMVDRLMPSEDWVVWDTIYKYKPTLSLQYWIPPYHAHATVSGNQHYMTFDKKFYEFAGDCSYLLAKDFRDGKFAVVVNYENQGGKTTKKSISVYSHDKQIEIFPDFKVLLDGQRVEMPVVFEDTIVIRQGDQIKLEDKKGLMVTCDLPNDKCTVNITGWYFGRTGGLLGTYDYEPFTDFTSSNNELADIPEFASSWSVGPRCRPINRAEEVDMQPGSRRYEVCAKYFLEESSIFRPCFKQVDHQAFMRMCMHDIPNDINKMVTTQDICKVATNYVDECKAAGVVMSMPSECVQCQLPSGVPFFEGDYITLKKNSRDAPIAMEADIVFVVDHGECNEDVLSNLKDIVDDTAKALKVAGMDARFGLVGYGHEEIEGPHSHTLEGQIFNSKDRFLLGLENFEMEDGENHDALEAVKFATSYPFRTGVSKSIILIPCSKCGEQKTSYVDVQQLLLNKDIKLHMLMEYDFKLRSKSPKVPTMFGVDNEGLFTIKSVNDKKMNGDRDLRTQVIMPKDICAALSEESDGSVFNVKTLTAGRPAIQKKFIDVFARLVAKKAEPSSCQICDCVADETSVAKADCRSCEIRTPIYGNMPMFTDDGEDVDPKVESPMAPNKADKKPKKKNARQRKTKFLKKGRN